jgi:hypothetical protein
MTQFFDVAMARLQLRKAKLSHASLVDMFEKLTAAEARRRTRARGGGAQEERGLGRNPGETGGSGKQARKN